MRCAMQQDYEAFYAQEIELRRELFYPPFSRLVKLLFQDVKRERAWTAAAAFVKDVQQKFADQTGCMVIGPSPALIERERNKYRYVVLIKTDRLADVQAFLREHGMHLRNDAAIDIDPITIF